VSTQHDSNCSIENKITEHTAFQVTDDSGIQKVHTTSQLTATAS